MNLTNICWELAGKILGKPGTLVERMRPSGCETVVQGEIYKVVSSDTGGKFIMVEGCSKFFCPDYFRKVSS